jgi:hypothetical protein
MYAWRPTLIPCQLVYVRQAHFYMPLNTNIEVNSESIHALLRAYTGTQGAQEQIYKYLSLSSQQTQYRNLLSTAYV